MPDFHIINIVQDKHQDIQSADFVSHVKNSLKFSSWYEATFDAEITFIAKKLAKNLPDESSNHVILVLGNDNTLNAVLNGLLSVERQHQLPISYIPLDLHTNFTPALHLKDKTNILPQLQQIHHPKFLNIGKICGDIPKQQTKYFISSVGIGFDTALTEYKKNSIKNTSPFKLNVLKNHFLTTKAFFNQKSFPVTINACSEYLQLPNSFLLTLKNKATATSTTGNLPETSIEIIVLRKMKMMQFVTGIIFNHKYLRSNIIHHVNLSPGDAIHVHDIQPGHIDGGLLGNGSFSFNVDQQSYPFWI
ncbi:MAG: diacylglycerol kinase [Leuconostoc mesenteroides]|jgi:diacylglycerol kinase family enzyme|uniref:Diacylglycerol kinase family protein n=3 Tax=Leuconostoc mesenteroides TaxID=1245 RepID=Q03VI6_LEUMM|nr:MULTISPECIES: diacylglycerol kinase family protein [Leuconostoc]ABJ62786.1 Diacylglycerol kinase family protein [Leuconostoc mesenteroides subsp. mesenteroides ATCC 8293]KMY77264.1 diacylglycerol kinase [Leuconostoc mesenteroides subsp. mesenteroides]MBZ1502916.1 diacylglycerol kinase [Leuconostoc mesenteroides]MCH3953409.1 diacylglycerol kinase [Leuconostoc mesenteroides]MCH3980295.1 diacylglycerol kinase [Leuconostoc mesenteroides]